MIAIAELNNPQKQHIMKKQLWILTLALPLLLVGCKPKETVKEKMNAGADKVAEGVKDMKNVAVDEAAKAKDAATAAAKESADKVKAAASDAAAKAKAAADAAAAKAKEDAAKALKRRRMP